MTVKILLKQVREKKGLSLNDLSRLSGVSPQYLSTLEKGKKNPSLDIVDKLCKALEVQVGELLLYEADV
ncbi:helix-turn-helix domain-containing protein [Nostoc sp.]|uniref:helix-turn-helix domain-containing protein n=1 Tax=Nostoc sp. TaxID=1180 RepID=UPI002FF6BD69